MPRFLLRYWLVLLGGSLPVTATLSSCSSDKKDAPQPTTGSISGTVSPGMAFRKMTATDTGGLPSVISLTYGASTPMVFTLGELKPGTYTVHFDMDSRYLQPADRSITVVAGQTASAGTVEADANPSVSFTSGSMSWIFNGQQYTTTTITGSSDAVGSHSFYLNGTATTGSNVDALQIRFPNDFSGLGTYNVSMYTPTTYHQLLNGVQTSYSTGNSLPGRLIFNTYDLELPIRRASGTFNFTMLGGSSSGTSSSISGSFDINL